MIDGMSEICIDCVHQEVCRYDCHRPSEHCNDRAVADDFIPQGEWVFRSGGYYKCSKCGEVERAEKNYCSNCGAKMKRGTENEQL